MSFVADTRVMDPHTTSLVAPFLRVKILTLSFARLTSANSEPYRFMGMPAAAPTID